MTPPSFFPPALQPVLEDTQNADILCTVCAGFLDRPVELGCGNLVCLECCIRWLTISSECPCCSLALLDHTHPPSKVTLSVLGHQLFKCDRGCNRTVRAIDYQQHLESQCQCFFQHSALSPSRTTLRELLEKDKDEPTTPTERKVAEHLLKRMLCEKEKDSLLRVANLTDAREGMPCSKLRSLLQNNHQQDANSQSALHLYFRRRYQCAAKI